MWSRHHCVSHTLQSEIKKKSNIFPIKKGIEKHFVTLKLVNLFLQFYLIHFMLVSLSEPDKHTN